MASMNWTISYTDFFGKKKVEAFADKDEAQARYESLLPRTYGDFGDLMSVTVPIRSATKISESVLDDVDLSNQWDDLTAVVKGLFIRGFDNPSGKYFYVKSDYRNDEDACHSVYSKGTDSHQLDIHILGGEEPLVAVVNQGLQDEPFDMAYGAIELIVKDWFNMVADGFHGVIAKIDDPSEYAVWKKSKGFKNEDGASASSLGVAPTGVVRRKTESKKNEGWDFGWFDKPTMIADCVADYERSGNTLDKRYGDWACFYHNQDGRPFVVYFKTAKDGGQWGVKEIESCMGPYETNIQAAKWLKPRLEEWTSKDPKNAEKIQDYEWEWIEKCLGKEASNKAKKDVVKSLVEGDRIKLIDTVADGAVVEFVRMLTPSKMLIKHNGREMGCKTSFIDHKIEKPTESVFDDDELERTGDQAPYRSMYAKDRKALQDALKVAQKYSPDAKIDPKKQKIVYNSPYGEVTIYTETFTGLGGSSDIQTHYEVSFIMYGHQHMTCDTLDALDIVLKGISAGVSKHPGDSWDDFVRNVKRATRKPRAKRSEAKNPYYGYGKDDAIDKDDNDFMWQVAYDWFEERLPEKFKQFADRAVTEVIDRDMRAYEEIVTMDDYYDYLETYGPAVIEEITGGFSESKKNENLTDKEEHEWYRFWFDDVKKHIVPGKSGSVEHNCKMLPYSDVRQMWGVAAMAKELCDNFRRYLSYRGYTNSKGSPFAEISWRAEDAGDLLTAMNKADGTPIESKKNEAGGADLASVYGSGDIVTHESSADGFYVDDHDPMGWAILNNDVDTMKELFAGTAPTPDKPWLYAGWDEYTDAPADKDGSYPYRYSWDSERDLNFVEDWKRVVGETNNEEALNLLLEHDHDFIPTAIDFYNAFLAGYDKKLLRKLLDNIRAVWDKDDINDSYLNYEDFGETPYENLIEFLGE